MVLKRGEEIKFSSTFFETVYYVEKPVICFNMI